MVGLLDFLPKGERGNYKVGDNCATKPCDVGVQITESYSEETNECSSSVLVEPRRKYKGMHWKSWDKLCAHKDNGGLGFKDLTDFNTAMLGKQLWRLIEKPNSLFSRIF